MTSQEGSPVAASERAVALDALRGMALFGVLIVNLVTIFRVSLFEQFLPLAEQFVPPGGSSAADHVVARVVAVGLEFKAFILFSLLFGTGLAAQRGRTSGGPSFGRYIARRLGFLLVLGLAHLFLVWNGDILTLYAVLGVLAALMVRLSTRVLLPIALALFVVQVLPLPSPAPFASHEAMHHHVTEARRIYAGGSFGEILAFRIREVRPISALLSWTVPRTLGLFVLGTCAWREGIFRGGRRNLARLMAIGGIPLGGAAVWSASSGVDYGRWRDTVNSWGAILLALGYGSAIVVAFARPNAARVLSMLAPLGRTALTSYLVQSVVLGLIFYGYGLGLFGRIGEARAAAIGVFIFAVQAAASALWLRRYRFGPVEWVWRSFTYGAWQPMRR